MFKWIVASLVLALTLSFVYHETKAVKAARVEVVAEYENEALEQALEALQIDKKLLEDKGIADAKTIEDKTRIVAQRDALIRSLQQRPTRQEAREASPESSSSSNTCTGAELSREDGEFLTREASRADELIVERDYYYGRYEDARQQLEKFNGKD